MIPNVFWGLQFIGWRTLRIPMLFITCLILSCSADEPKFEVLDQSPVSLTSDDRVIFINYWAVWCIPCLEEMPALAAFRQDNQEQVEVYAVNYDNPELAQLRTSVDELGVKIPSLLNDPYEILGYPRPLVLPSTIVMRSGEVLEILRGAQDRESLQQVLGRWL